MKIKVYGGCHALALTRLINSFTEHDADFSINFQMMDRDDPLPYDDWGMYDAIVYSPINRPGKWNTEYLERHFRGTPTKLVSYPWIQWNGYFPSAEKHEKEKRQGGWKYRYLTELADESETFDDFATAALAATRIRPTIEDTANATLERLRDAESNCVVSLSGFISEHFRQRRLFLTPDHPCIPVYAYCLQKICDALDIKLDQSLHWSATEPQYGYKIPIIPAVPESLGLGFFDSDYQNIIDHKIIMGFQDYLRMEFARIKANIFYPSIQTWIKRVPIASASLSSDALLRLEPTDHIIGALQGHSAGHAEIFVRKLWRSAEMRYQTVDDTMYIFEDHLQ